MEVNYQDNVTGNFSFTWTIEEVSTLSEEGRFSDIIPIGPDKWQFQLAFHMECDTTDDNYLSFDVFPVECKKIGSGKINLAIIDQTDEKNTLRKEGQMVMFEEGENYWAFDKFIQLKELNDPTKGYIVNDVCIIEGRLYFNSVEDSTNVGSLSGNNCSSEMTVYSKLRRRGMPAPSSEEPTMLRTSSGLHLDKLTKQVKDDSLVTSCSNDIRTLSLGNVEHSGNVGGMGSFSQGSYSHTVPPKIHEGREDGLRVEDELRKTNERVDRLEEQLALVLLTQGGAAPTCKSANTRSSKMNQAETSNSKTEFTYKSSLGPLCKTASALKKLMTVEHLKALDKFPFWNMYRHFHEGRFTLKDVKKFEKVAAGLKMIIDFFLENRDNKEFECFKSTPELLAVIFGLQRIQESQEIERISLQSKQRATSMAVEHYQFYTDYLIGEGMPGIQKSIVEENLLKTAQDPSKVKEFFRLLATYICIQVFFSNGNGCQLRQSLVPLIFELEKVSWPDRIHEHLMNLIDQCKNPSRLNGCTVYMMYWFAEHFVKTGEQLSQKIPRFLRWNTYDITRKVKDGIISLSPNSEPSFFMASLTEQERTWATRQMLRERAAEQVENMMELEKAKLSEIQIKSEKIEEEMYSTRREENFGSTTAAIAYGNFDETDQEKEAVEIKKEESFLEAQEMDSEDIARDRSEYSTDDEFHTPASSFRR